MKKILASTALAVSVALSLTGCGDDAPSSAGQRGSSSLPPGVNDADVTFATEMIQHHAGALSMTDLTMGRMLDSEVQAVVDDIRAAQGPELETMAAWLREWDEPVPETVRDHANAHDDHSGGDTGSQMPGMLSTEEMAELEDATGAEFEDSWLRAMIEHHEGAIEMADTERSDGENADAVALARKIASDQEAEIARMERLLGS